MKQINKMLSRITHTSRKAVIPMAPELLKVTLTELTKLHRSKKRMQRFELLVLHESYWGNVRKLQVWSCWPCLALYLQHWMSASQAWSIDRAVWWNKWGGESGSPQYPSSARISLCSVLSARNTWQWRGVKNPGHSWVLQHSRIRSHILALLNRPGSIPHRTEKAA